MLVLALDSSTRGGSVALALDGLVLDVRAGEATIRHAARLPGDLIDLLAAHGRTPKDVDLLAAAIGPGGFTGLRVGLATMQGLAMALDRRVFMASTLDLIAQAVHDAAPDARWVGALMHGMRGEAFTALYQADTMRGTLDAVVPAMVGTPEQAAAAWTCGHDATPIAVGGDGWPGAGAPVVARFGTRLRPQSIPLLAAPLAALACARAGEAVVPAAVRPAYVRRPDAVIAREQAGLSVAGDI